MVTVSDLRALRTRSIKTLRCRKKGEEWTLHLHALQMPITKTFLYLNTRRLGEQHPCQKRNCPWSFFVDESAENCRRIIIGIFRQIFRSSKLLTIRRRLLAEIRRGEFVSEMYEINPKDRTYTSNTLTTWLSFNDCFSWLVYHYSTRVRNQMLHCPTQSVGLVGRNYVEWDSVYGPAEASFCNSLWDEKTTVRCAISRGSCQNQFVRHEFQDTASISAVA